MKKQDYDYKKLKKRHQHELKRTRKQRINRAAKVNGSFTGNG